MSHGGRVRRAAAKLRSCSRHEYLVRNIAPPKRGYHDVIPATRAERVRDRSVGKWNDERDTGDAAAVTGRAEAPRPRRRIGTRTAIPSIRHSCLHDHAGISLPCTRVLVCARKARLQAEAKTCPNANMMRWVRTARGCPQVAAPKTPAPGGKAGLLWPHAGGLANGRSRSASRGAGYQCPRRLRPWFGVLVELSAPPTGSASAPRRSKMRSRDHRWCAGGNRCRHPSNGAGRIAAGRDGGSGGGRSSLDSAGRSQRSRRSVRRSGPTGARLAGGGGVAGPALAPVGPARGCRQRRDRPDWHRVCDRFLPPSCSSLVPSVVRFCSGE